MFKRVQKSRRENLFIQIGAVVLSAICIIRFLKKLQLNTTVGAIQYNGIVQLIAITILLNFLLGVILCFKTKAYLNSLYKSMDNFYQKVPVCFLGLKLGAYEKDGIGRISYVGGSYACKEAENYLRELVMPTSKKAHI